MVIDKATSSSQNPASAMDQSANTFAQTPQLANEDHSDLAPPPYESVVPTLSPYASTPSPRASTSSPRASIDRTSKKSVSESTSASSSPVVPTDLTPQDIARISPLLPEEHISPCFLRTIPFTSDSSVTCERLPRPFVINPRPGASTIADSFAVAGIPALYKHDVQEEDWEELLRDIRTCARPSSTQRVVSSVLPIAKCLGPPGCLANLIFEQTVKKQKTSGVVALLDLWNERFFRPRRLEAILCRGDKRKSGRDIDFLAPDRMDAPLNTSDSLSSSMPSKHRQCTSRCCRRSGGHETQSNPKEVEKPYRLVVVSI